MAARKKTAPNITILDNEISSPVKSSPAFVENPKFKVFRWVAIVLIVLTYWWWKTQTWPVVAVIGNHIVTRYEIDRGLFKQYGKTYLQDLIIQKSVELQAKAEGLTPSESEINAKIEEVKKSLPSGQTIESVLTDRGMTLDELKQQIGLRLAVEAAAGKAATVSAAEIDQYIKDNGKFLTGKTDADKRKEAEDTLKNQKLQEEIGKWVEKAQKSTRTWTWYK